MKVVDTDPKKIDELLSRGVVEIIDREKLRTRMLRGERLRIKLGIDPTSQHLHIGRSIPLLKARDFQKLGHQIVLIVGDFTSTIGDTSDKDAERPMIDESTVHKNKKTYFQQMGKIINLKQAELHYNSKWLKKLKYAEIGFQTNLFSVADFIARENIKKRLDAGKRVSMRELMYPLMQGFDSVKIKADVELGGSDQRFNTLAGRTMQPAYSQDPQAIILGPLVNGIDGRKMSSSWGNTINLTAEPNDMYGKVMRMHDAEIITYFTVCTRTPLEKVYLYEKELVKETNPRDIKMKLAYTIVEMYHGTIAADAAEKEFIATFQKGAIPDDVPEITAPYTSTLVEKGVVKSKTELRRLIDSGSVRNAETGEKLINIPESVTQPTVVKIGKRRFVKMVVTIHKK